MRALARCYDHKNEVILPQLCHVCQRIAVEHKIVRKTVNALLAAGYALATDEGEHRFYGKVNPTTDREALFDTLWQADDEYLGVFDAAEATGKARACKPHSWVRFVYGNDGWDVISDYTTNLEDILKPVTDYARRFEV